MDYNDKRFSKIGVDPKFKRVPKAERKVKIDKRFQSMFNDKRFKVKYTIDKRGRPLHGSTTEDFKKFYHMSDDEGDDEIQNSEVESSDDQKSDEPSIVDDEDVIEQTKINKKIKDRLKDSTVDYARGDGVLVSDSSSDDDTSSDEENEGKFVINVIYILSNIPFVHIVYIPFFHDKYMFWAFDLIIIE